MRTLRALPLRLEELEPRLVLSGTHGTLPTTEDHVHLFSDQLTTALSDSLVHFIASRFDGVQKLTSSQNARYADVNPNWFLLNYRLATASGPVDYIHNDQWGSDWSDVTSHEDWFMHNADNQRLQNDSWDWDLNDITNPDFVQYFIDSTIADMRATGAQGLFGDSFEAGIGGWWFSQYDARFDGTNAADPTAWPDGVDWLDKLHNYAGAVEAAYHNAPENFQFIPNVDALVTSWATQDFSNLDGAFLEDFGDWGGGYNGSTSDWVLSMNRALPMAAADQVLIMQPYLSYSPTSEAGLRQREYLLGTYLLLQSDYTYLNIVAPDQGLDASYYPEYDVNLGSPKSAVATDVSQYAWNGLYRRDFDNGIVLVNPGTSDITVNLGSYYRLMSASGGGVLSGNSLDSSGHYVGGSLSYQTVNSVTVKAGGAAILLNPATPVDLSSYFNQTGIVSDGTAFSGTDGLGGSGYAYSAALLGNSLTAGGSTFNLGAADSANVVQAAGQTLTLPGGRFGTLSFLATAVNGNQLNQTFIVNYTDGSSATFTQSLSDWGNRAAYSGESTAATFNYRNTFGGNQDSGTWSLNLYTFNLDPSKTVSSITLPSNGNIDVLAIDLTP